MYDYAMLGKDTYDWDCGYLHTLTLFYLKRLKIGLEMGYAVHEPNDLKALNVAIKLLEIALKNDYGPSSDRHDEKWGKLETWFELCVDRPDMYEWKSKRANAITEEEKKQEREEFLHCYQMDGYLQEKRIQIAYKIIMKYYRKWWD
jgi:hypothetical protein